MVKMKGYYLWQNYKISEISVIDYLSYVPWDELHFGVWSDRLASILIDIGSKVDSSFRNTLDSKFLDTCLNIKDVREKDIKNVNINDFAKIYNSYYGLSEKEIRFLSSPILSLIKPWENWTESSSPSWWQAYNQVKHDRFKHTMEATLQNVIKALGALFLNCVILQEYQPYLVNIEIIKGLYTKEHTKCELIKNVEPNLNEISPLVAKSELLGYFYEPRNGRGWEVLDLDNVLNF